MEINPYPHSYYESHAINSKKRLKNIASSFINSYLDFGYYTLVFPFHIKSFPAKQQCSTQSLIIQTKLHTNRFQQLLCLIVHLLIMLQYFSEIRQIKYDTLSVKESSPGTYFKIFDDWTNFAYKISIILKVWFDKQTFFRVSKYIQSSKNVEIFQSESAIKLQVP